MSGQTRRRGVRLKPEALKELSERLDGMVDRHVAAHPDARPNRELEAEIIGLSVRTVGKILRGEPVDKNTLCVAFRHVGLRWDESFCELPADHEDQPTVPLAQVRPKRRLEWLFAVALVPVVVVAGAVQVWRPLWRQDEGHRAFIRGMDSAAVLYQSGDYVKARATVDSLEPLAKKSLNVNDIGWVLRLKGDLDTVEGNYTKALDEYQQAMSLMRSAGLSAYYLSALEGAADTELRLGMLNEAKRDYTERLGHATKARQPVEVAASYRGLATVAAALGNTTEAEKLFNRALGALGHQEDPAMSIDIRARKAVALASATSYDESIQTLQQCLAFWTKRGHNRWIATTEYQLAGVYLMQGAKAKADVLLADARSRYQAAGDKDGVTRCDKLGALDPARARSAAGFRT